MNTLKETDWEGDKLETVLLTMDNYLRDYYVHKSGGGFSHSLMPPDLNDQYPMVSSIFVLTFQVIN